MRLIALFNLRPGISADAYEAWARTVDLPTVNALGSVESFTVFRVTGLLRVRGARPYGYVEIIDVPDMERFGSDVAGETMQAIAAAFQDMADVTFLTTEPLLP